MGRGGDRGEGTMIMAMRNIKYSVNVQKVKRAKRHQLSHTGVIIAYMLDEAPGFFNTKKKS